MTEESYKKPSLARVAKLAGVSKSLASLALRGEDGVSVEARRKILAVANSLDSELSPLALSRVKEGPRFVGALMTDLTNPYHSEVVAGMESVAHSMGFSVMIADGQRNEKRMRSHLEDLIGVGVDGIVVISTWLGAQPLLQAAQKVPVAVVGSLPQYIAGVDSVTNDDFDGASQAVEHLVAMGHERIAFVAESDRTSSVRRSEGYRSVMRRMCREQHAKVLQITELEENPQLLNELVQNQNVTAIFCTNDMTAIRVADLAETLAIKIPTELSIVGYDNTQLAMAFRPKLSSVDQPRHAMGVEAMHLIAERLGGRTFDKNLIKKPRLITRSSSAANV